MCVCVCVCVCVCAYPFKRIKNWYKEMVAKIEIQISINPLSHGILKEYKYDNYAVLLKTISL